MPGKGHERHRHLSTLVPARLDRGCSRQARRALIASRRSTQTVPTAVTMEITSCRIVDVCWHRVARPGSAVAVGVRAARTCTLGVCSWRPVGARTLEAHGFRTRGMLSQRNTRAGNEAAARSADSMGAAVDFNALVARDPFAWVPDEHMHTCLAADTPERYGSK